jgi:hypothetical protein
VAEYGAGERVVITAGPLSGVEGVVVRRTRMLWQDACLVELETSAPRWAAIRRTRVATWALEPAGLGEEQAGRLHWRRRVATAQVALALLLPVLVVLLGRVPAVGGVLAVGWLVAMAALASIARHHGPPAAEATT